MLTAGAAPHLLEPPINALRLALHPEGMAPRIENLGEWRAHLLRDLAAQVDATGDEELDALLEELRGATRARTASPAPHDVFVPLRDRRPEAFLSTRTTFATAVDVTVSELAIESFFPADARRRAQRAVEMTLEVVEPVRPVAAVRREPAVDLGQRRGVEPVPAPLRVDPHPHEPGLAQHPQVLGDARLAQPQVADELVHRPLALAQQVEDPPPAGVGQDVEDLHDGSMTAKAYSARR